jgi:hypothetical protein
MNEPQKIWFVYLTDHHEGPFTPEEVAAMVASGAVNLQTLGWKDGMAEWIPIESIPELKAAVDNPPPAAGDGGGAFSLAEMLAKQQGGGGAAPAASDAEPEFSSGAEALASFVGNVNQSAGSAGIQEVPPSFAAAAPSAGAEPSPDQEVWTMRVNAQVSGLYSLNQLRNMAAGGEVPPHAMLWHSGWTDFQPLSAVPELSGAAQAKRLASMPNYGSSSFGGSSGSTFGGTNTGLTAGGGVGRKPVFAPITASANVGDDEKTDTGIDAGGARGGGSDGEKGAGLKNLLAKITEKFSKKKPAPKGGEKTRTGLSTQPSFTKGSGKVAPKGGGAAGSAKRIAMLIGFFLLLGGGGYGYLQFFASPIPADLDVLPDDLELLKETVKAPAAEGGRLYLAPAKGTDENPADDSAPKFYVGSNLPAGTPVSMAIVGKPGSLVNRVSFEKQFSAVVNEGHLAVFERLEDDGKPLPMGEYSVKVSAEGAAPLAFDRFMGGKKGAVYQDRLKKYKDKLQADYDREMQELRETIDTLKQLSADTTKKIAEYKAGWNAPANRARLTADWKTFSSGAQLMLTQLDQKLKARNASGVVTYQPRAFQDVGTTVAQVQQLIQAHGKRLEGVAPTVNLDELEGFVTSGVASLEQSLAQALVKSPFDVLGTKGGQDGGATNGAAPEATAAPANGNSASVAAPEAAAPAATPAPQTAPATAPAR